MQFPTSNFQLPWVTWNLPTIENPGSGDCFFVPIKSTVEMNFPNPKKSYQLPYNAGRKQVKSYSVHVRNLYLQFNFMLHLNAGKYTIMPEKNENIKCQKKWRPWWSLNSIQGIAAWKITKIGYFPFNKAGKNEFPLNHWCDTCNFSGVLNLFIENGKLPTRKYSGLDFLHWEWLDDKP